MTYPEPQRGSGPWMRGGLAPESSRLPSGRIRARTMLHDTPRFAVGRASSGHTVRQSELETPRVQCLPFCCDKTMTTIATFTTPEDAHLFRTCLASQGIEGFLLDEHFVQLFWYYSNTIGGVRVVVEDDDAETAIIAYKKYMTALRAGPYPLNPVRAWPVVLLMSLLFGIPFILLGRHVHRGSRTTYYLTWIFCVGAIIGLITWRMYSGHQESKAASRMESVDGRATSKLPRYGIERQPRLEMKMANPISRDLRNSDTSCRLSYVDFG